MLAQNETQIAPSIEPEMATAVGKIRSALALLGKGKKTAAEMRILIMGLEAAMQAMPGSLDAEDFKTTHHFAPGIYMRELFIPKGTVLTGKIHKTEHLNIMSQGRLTVWTEDGMKTVTASTVIKSQPGIKRVGYAHEDSVWITVHPNVTDEREIRALEDLFIAKTFEEIFGSDEQLALFDKNEEKESS